MTEITKTMAAAEVEKHGDVEEAHPHGGYTEAVRIKLSGVSTLASLNRALPGDWEVSTLAGPNGPGYGVDARRPDE